MPAELAVGYITLIPSARGIAAGLEKEMTGPLVLAGKTSGAKSSAGFGAAFKSGLKTAAVGVGLVAAAVAIGKSFEDAFNKIQRGTGATGDTLKSLDGSFKSVLKGGSGSFDQVSAAITTLFQRTGLTGKALEDFAAKEVTLARITKTDVNANLQATTGLFNLYGIAAANQSDKLDVLFKASQVAGVSITQLASDMQSAAPTAKILGLNIDQTAGLVANLEKAGLPASKVMLGLAGAFAKAAKAGKDPLTVVHDLVAQIKAAPTATDAATIAIQKFGIGARQASTLVAGIRSGAIDLTKSLDGGKGILATAAATQTLSGKLAHLKNVALVGLEPLATAALGALIKGLELILPVVDTLTQHMDILGPVIIGVATAFIAFKVAVGVSKAIEATTKALEGMKAALLGGGAAQVTATAAAATAAAAKTAEAVAATEAAAALSIEAEAAAAAAAAGGAVDLAAFSAAAALQTEAVAATEAAAAMTASAAATEEAVVASEAFSITPIGLVVAAAAVALTAYVAVTHIFSHAQKDAGEATNSLIDSLLKEGKTLGDVAGQVLVKAIGDNHKLADAFKALGVPLKTVSEALTGNKKALAEVVAAEHAKLKSGKLTLSQASLLGKSFRENSKSLHDTNRDFNNAAAANTNLAKAEGGTVHYAEIAAAAQDALRLAATNLTTAIINNADRLRGLQEGLIGVFQSAINLKQGLTDIADKQKAYNDAVAQFGPKSKEAVKAQQDLQLTQLGQASSTLSSVDSTVKWADSMAHLTDRLKDQTDAQDALSKATSDFQSGKGSPEQVAAAQEVLNHATTNVTASQKKYHDILVAMAGQIDGPLHDALITAAGNVANLSHEFAQVPNTKTTTYSTPGLPTAVLLTHNFRGELDGLKPKKVTITLAADEALHSLALLDAAVRKINPNISLVAVNRAQAGGRASGGDVQAGSVHLVGEKGPEFVQFKQDAHVFAHGQIPFRVDKNFATGLGGGGAIDARVIINGPVHGVDDLDDWADRRDRKLTMALAAGHR